MTPKPRCSGDHGHRRNDHQRIVDRHLHRVLQRGARRALVDVVNPQHVGEENRVELAALQRARQVGPVFQRIVGIRPIARMRPQAGRLMADAVHVERVQADLFRHRVQDARKLHRDHVDAVRPGEGVERRVLGVNEDAGQRRNGLAVAGHRAVDHDPVLAAAPGGIGTDQALAGGGAIPPGAHAVRFRADDGAGFGPPAGPATDFAMMPAGHRAQRGAILRHRHEARARIEAVAQGEVMHAGVVAGTDRTIGGVFAGEMHGHRRRLVRAHGAVPPTTTWN